MMQGIDVGCGDMAEAICATCFQHGLIIETSGAHDEVVKVLAPLTIPQEQFAKGSGRAGSRRAGPRPGHQDRSGVKA